MSKTNRKERDYDKPRKKRKQPRRCSTVTHSTFTLQQPSDTADFDELANELIAEESALGYYRF